VILDVGGGSTELIADGFRTSLDVGSVRLTERFGDDVDAAAAYVRERLPELDVERVLGVDGTTAEIAASAGARTVAPAVVEELFERLRVADPEERRSLLVLEPERTEVIVAGVLIVREVLRRYRATALDASDRDLLDGAALEAAELAARAEGDAPPGAFTCC
jgi:exopolyphosphatase/guanosine-5'-triphosphate,3'-diphosphate pyrophosphatase